MQSGAPQSKKIIFSIVLFTALFLTVFILNSNFRLLNTKFLYSKILKPISKNISHDQLECLTSVAVNWKLCVLEQLSKTNRHDFLWRSAQTCYSNYSKYFNVIPLETRGEIKYIVPPDQGNDTDCTVISLGVGNDIDAELSLKKFQPACKFFGADPIYDAGIIYKNVGTYYQVAVGAKEGNLTASVFVDNTYKDRISTHITFMKFLKWANLSFVDYLIMDAEGAEYGLIPLLETSKRAQLMSRINICQLNVEIHFPNSHPELNEVFRSFLINSPYVPLVVSEATHYRAFWMDIMSEKCVQKYLPDFCSM